MADAGGVIGGAVGSFFGPAGTAFGSALGSGVSGALGGAPAGPSNAESGAYGSGIDASGWAVNFSGVQNVSSSQDKSGGVPGVFGGSGIAGGVPWYVWAGLAGVALWRLMSER